MIARTLLAAGVTLAAVAGCSSAGPAPGRSSSSSGPRDSSTARPAPATSTAPAVPSTAPVPVNAAPSATASPVAPGTSTAPPAAAPPTPRSTCRSLLIRVIRGSAAPGYEFAALQFVNTGATRCELYGYPTVTLRLGGAPVGRASSPAGVAGSHVSLAPGATAESRLQDFSSCQAPLSDEIRVVAPGSSITTSRPGQLRACSLRVSALGPPE